MKYKEDQLPFHRAHSVWARLAMALSVATIAVVSLTAGWSLSASAQGGADGAADVVVTMTVSNSAPSVGDEVSFTVTVANNGAGETSELVVEDVLAPSLTLARVTTVDGQVVFDDSSRALRWILGDLAPGGSVSLVFAVIVGEGFIAPITNVAVANVGGEELDPSNNTASATIEPAEPVADVALGGAPEPESPSFTESPSGAESPSDTEPVTAAEREADTGSETTGVAGAEPLGDSRSADSSAPNGSGVAIPPDDQTAPLGPSVQPDATMSEESLAGGAVSPLGLPPESLAFAGSRNEHVATVVLMCVMSALVAVALLRRSPALVAVRARKRDATHRTNK